MPIEHLGRFCRMLPFLLKNALVLFLPLQSQSKESLSVPLFIFKLHFSLKIVNMILENIIAKLSITNKEKNNLRIEKFNAGDNCRAYGLFKIDFPNFTQADWMRCPVERRKKYVILSRLKLKEFQENVENRENIDFKKRKINIENDESRKKQKICHF
jgi:hypothetical protein